MKYNDLIHFEPITSVIKLVTSGEKQVAENLVKTFVFSKKIKEDIQEVIIKNLVLDPGYETKGIQIVGSYGTGKSHLMALVSGIAEFADLVEYLQDEQLKDAFKKIAGKYRVLRFEIGADTPLKEIVFAQIGRFLNEKIGIPFAFEEKPRFSWKEQLQEMMSAFEAKVPDQHLLIVIDELLEYLKGRTPTELNNDLMLMRQLGELCDNTRFKLIFGVQELLYRTPEFQFQSEMLNKVEDRYADLIITKEDVSFVVEERLLKKDLHQKEKIREHLLKFAHLFEGINVNLNKYVDLFPVHPNYVSYFERIKHGKSQREILKILSTKFEKILQTEVPTTNPGLITYDSYWEDLSSPSMLTIPDIRSVKEKVEIIHDKIIGHFTQGRENRRELAKRIANALAIRILCDDLNKRNGANGISLKEDLCETIPGVEDPELLVAAVESTAKMLITATAGQYVEQDPTSGQYYLRTEDTVNFEQLVRDYSEDMIKRDPDQADQSYFAFLQYILGLQQNTYRTGFKIWQHSLEWIDKKSFRLGYTFFGNPNERSTTEPIQQYYIFFCPIFSSITRNDEADEVYFDMTTLSSEFKDLICLLGAAKAKEVVASSSQRPHFANLIKEYRDRAIALFEKEYVDKTRVIYKGSEKPLRSFPLPGEGSTKDMIFSVVSARVLSKHFNDKFQDYPAFLDLLQPLSQENFDARISSAIKKIMNPSAPNRDGEAILSGLGLWNGTSIDIQHSKYARSILDKLREKGEGKVLNKDEVLYCHYAQQNLYYSVDYNIDHQLEFLVLAALVYKGDIEIIWSPSKTLIATNIENLNIYSEPDYFTFQNIRKPKGMPLKSLKMLFTVLGLPDLTSDLEKPETITKIISSAKTMVDKVVKARAIVSSGLKCKGVALIREDEAIKMKSELEVLSTMLDVIQSYNTTGRLKGFKYSEDELSKAFEANSYCDAIDKLAERARKFEKLIGYLYTAQSYVVESDQPLYDDMNAAIGKLGSVILSDKDAEIRKFESLLNSLRDRYVDYYIGYYTRCRLSDKDARSKDRIMNSNQKKICDIIKDADFITSTEYQNWINSITSLREADSRLTKAMIQEEPYHDFNPREYYGKTSLKIQDIETLLNGILDKWINAMRSMFKDPSVHDNLELLKPDERTLVEGFRDEKIAISLENAIQLRNLISQLAQGIDKVIVNLDDLRIKFNRPFTPDEAIDALSQYINELCTARERKKVRIILK
jgi:hypothetical protein